MRSLIVNADDLGLSDAVNAGIVEAFDRGIVTSASLMVRRPAAAAAVGLASGRPALAVGLHLDLAKSGDRAAAERECRAQLEAFREATGRDPTHVDSHHHFHRREPVAGIAATIAGELRVPLRGSEIRYEGGFFARSADGGACPELITVERLVGLIESLPPGWTEIGCHPGIGVGLAESSYAGEREVEVGTLCARRVADAMERAGVMLRSFAQFPPAASLQ